MKAADSDCPDIVILDAPLSEAELKSLYGQCQVFVMSGRAGGRHARFPPRRSLANCPLSRPAGAAISTIAATHAAGWSTTNSGGRAPKGAWPRRSGWNPSRRLWTERCAPLTTPRLTSGWQRGAPAGRGCWQATTGPRWRGGSSNLWRGANGEQSEPPTSSLHDHFERAMRYRRPRRQSLRAYRAGWVTVLAASGGGFRTRSGWGQRPQNMDLGKFANNFSEGSTGAVGTPRLGRQFNSIMISTTVNSEVLYPS